MLGGGPAQILKKRLRVIVARVQLIPDMRLPGFVKVIHGIGVFARSGHGGQPGDGVAFGFVQMPE